MKSILLLIFFTVFTPAYSGEGIYEVTLDKVSLTFEPEYEEPYYEPSEPDNILVKGAMLFVLNSNRTGKKDVINGYSGEWLKLSLGEHANPYVFDGFLKKINYNVIYNKTGRIKDYSCGAIYSEADDIESCFLTITDSSGKDFTGFCNSDECKEYQSKTGMSEKFKGKKIKIKYYDNERIKNKMKIGCTCCCDNESSEKFYKLYVKGRKFDVTPGYNGMIIFEVKEL